MAPGPASQIFVARVLVALVRPTRSVGPWVLVASACAARVLVASVSPARRGAVMARVAHARVAIAGIVVARRCRIVEPVALVVVAGRLEPALRLLGCGSRAREPARAATTGPSTAVARMR